MVDVNGMWSRDEALAAAPVLRKLGVVLVEQPLPPWRPRMKRQPQRSPRRMDAYTNLSLLPTRPSGQLQMSSKLGKR